MCIILFYYRTWHFLHLFFLFITVSIFAFNYTQILINNISDHFLSILDSNPHFSHSFHFILCKVSFDYKRVHKYCTRSTSCVNGIFSWLQFHISHQLEQLFARFWLTIFILSISDARPTLLLISEFHVTGNISAFLQQRCTLSWENFSSHKFLRISIQSIICGLPPYQMPFITCPFLGWSIFDYS